MILFILAFAAGLLLSSAEDSKTLQTQKTNPVTGSTYTATKGMITKYHSIGRPFQRSMILSSTETAKYQTISGPEAPTDPSNLLTVKLLNSECVVHDGAHLSLSTQLSSFKVDNVISCWYYCRYVGYCAMFSFHTLFRTCSLHKQQSPEYTQQAASFLMVGNINCLECLRSLEDIREQPGVLIVGSNRLCLAATNKEFQLNNTKGYHLTWKPCYLADTWVIDWGKENRIDRISQLDSNWRIAWIQEKPENLPFGYLTNTSGTNSSDNILIFKISWRINEACTFNIEAQLKESKIKIIGFGENPNSFYSLQAVLFILPFPGLPCSAAQFSIRNGKFLNTNRVPFFLPNKSVEVLCLPGFGVKAHNFSPYQEIICSPNARLNHCTTLTTTELVKYQVEKGIIFILGILLFIYLVALISKKLVK